MCNGHPQKDNIYHQHNWPACIYGWENTNPSDTIEYAVGNTANTAYQAAYGSMVANPMNPKIRGIDFDEQGNPSPIIGISFDGWPIYGPYDASEIGRAHV